jgi:hypothetical protein
LRALDWPDEPRATGKKKGSGDYRYEAGCTPRVRALDVSMGGGEWVPIWQYASDPERCLHLDPYPLAVLASSCRISKEGGRSPAEWKSGHEGFTQDGVVKRSREIPRK